MVNYCIVQQSCLMEVGILYIDPVVESHLGKFAQSILLYDAYIGVRLYGFKLLDGSLEIA